MLLVYNIEYHFQSGLKCVIQWIIFAHSHIIQNVFMKGRSNGGTETDQHLHCQEKRKLTVRLTHL